MYVRIEIFQTCHQLDESGSGMQSDLFWPSPQTLSPRPKCTGVSRHVLQQPFFVVNMYSGEHIL
jgi:hypothetical protein